MTPKEIIKKFESIETDKDKWVWVQNNQDLGITVNLDNDDTFITVDSDENGEYGQFHGYIGWSDGVFDLLEVMGIKADSV